MKRLITFTVLCQTKRLLNVQATTNPGTVNTGTPSSRNFHALPRDGGAELGAPGLPAADQSHHAARSMSANASPSGLIPPSIPTFSGSTTSESQPSGARCGEFANASDVDDGERGCSVEDGDEESVAEAMAPFVAKIAARVRSASRTNLLLPPGERGGRQPLNVARCSMRHRNCSCQFPFIVSA